MLQNDHGELQNVKDRLQNGHKKFKMAQGLDWLLGWDLETPSVERGCF